MSEDTIKKLEAELSELKSEKETLSQEIGSLRQEAAKHRLARNEALRQNKVLDTVISAHNIKFSLEDANYDSLSIDNGKVIGEFEYKPPKVAKVEPKENENKQPADKPLDIEAIKNMSAKQIMADYDNVMAAMENSRS